MHLLETIRNLRREPDDTPDALSPRNDDAVEAALREDLNDPVIAGSITQRDVDEFVHTPYSREDRPAAATANTTRQEGTTIFLDRTLNYLSGRRIQENLSRLSSQDLADIERALVEHPEALSAIPDRLRVALLGPSIFYTMEGSTITYNLRNSTFGRSKSITSAELLTLVRGKIFSSLNDELASHLTFGQVKDLINYAIHHPNVPNRGAVCETLFNNIDDSKKAELCRSLWFQAIRHDNLTNTDIALPGTDLPQFFEIFSLMARHLPQDKLTEGGYLSRIFNFVNSSSMLVREKASLAVLRILAADCLHEDVVDVYIARLADVFKKDVVNNYRMVARIYEDPILKNYQGRFLNAFTNYFREATSSTEINVAFGAMQHLTEASHRLPLPDFFGAHLRGWISAVFWWGNLRPIPENLTAPLYRYDPHTSEVLKGVFFGIAIPLGVIGGCALGAWRKSNWGLGVTAVASLAIYSALLWDGEK